MDLLMIKQTIGLRNEGIRMWDGNENLMKFWEFDIYGGITEGFMGVSTDGFYYQYEYPDGNGGYRYTEGFLDKKR